MSPSGIAAPGAQGFHHDGTVDVVCWCGSRLVRVSRGDMLAGQTRACPKPGCQQGTEPGDLAERAPYGTVNRRQGYAERAAGFGGPEVCRIVGCSYRQLDYWARTDLVRPSVADAKGSGTQRRYSYGDVVMLAIVRAVLDAGLSLRQAGRLVERLRADAGPLERGERVTLPGLATVVVTVDLAAVRAVVDAAIGDAA